MIKGWNFFYVFALILFNILRIGIIGIILDTKMSAFDFRDACEAGDMDKVKTLITQVVFYIYILIK